MCETAWINLNVFSSRLSEFSRFFSLYGWGLLSYTGVSIFAVKSMFQSELENMMGKSGLKMKLDAPQDIVDDPTMEIRRLRSYVSRWF